MASQLKKLFLRPTFLIEARKPLLDHFTDLALEIKKVNPNAGLKLGAVPDLPDGDITGIVPCYVKGIHCFGKHHGFDLVDVLFHDTRKDLNLFALMKALPHEPCQLVHSSIPRVDEPKHSDELEMDTLENALKELQLLIWKNTHPYYEELVKIPFPLTKTLRYLAAEVENITPRSPD